jgi:hypothetical protein
VVAKGCELDVLEGRVLCPSKGRIDVELCVRCPHLRAFYDNEDGTTMVCKPPKSLSAAQAAALAWPFAPFEY